VEGDHLVGQNTGSFINAAVVGEVAAAFGPLGGGAGLYKRFHGASDGAMRIANGESKQADLNAVPLLVQQIDDAAGGFALADGHAEGCMSRVEVVVGRICVTKEPFLRGLAKEILAEVAGDALRRGIPEE